MKAKKIILILILSLKVITTISQNKQDETLLVTNFVKAVFFENKSAKFVANNYMYFEPINGSKYTIDDRIKILNKHLKQIKKEKKQLLDSKSFKIVPYNNYEGTKAVFTKGTENVYVLVSKNNLVMYFSLLNNKILSFDYINKGDEGLFVTY